MATTRVNFRLPDDLVERADLAAAVTGKSRTGVVTDALRAHLLTLKADEGFERALVDLYLDDAIDFDDLRRVLDRRDAEAVRASKALIDDGEAIADALADAGPESP